MALTQSTPVESPSGCSRIYGPLAAYLALCALVLLARPNWSLYPPRVTGVGSPLAIPATEKLLGSVESAGVSRQIVGRVDGKIVLAGWAAFADPHLSLSRILILVDGAPRAEIHSFFGRSDIAARFGRENFTRSGWETPFSLSGMRPGDHILAVQAFAETGESSQLRAVQLRVIE